MPTYLQPVQGVQYSEAWAEACAVAPIHRPILVTLEFLHPAFTEPARLVADELDLEATLELDAPVDAGAEVLFRALPIQVLMPTESEEGGQAFQLQLDGVSRVVAKEFDRALETLVPVQLIVREYAPDDAGGPCRIPPPRFEVSGGEVDETTVRVSAVMGERVNKGFPARDFIAAEYPGLTSR